MKFSSKEKSKVIAKQNGWTQGRAEGYVDGERSRRRNTAPSKYVLIGIDDYCLGFRAGYFANARKSRSAKSIAG